MAFMCLSFVVILFKCRGWWVLHSCSWMRIPTCVIELWCLDIPSSQLYFLALSLSLSSAWVYWNNFTSWLIHNQIIIHLGFDLCGLSVNIPVIQILTILLLILRSSFARKITNLKTLSGCCWINSHIIATTYNAAQIIHSKLLIFRFLSIIW